ncbi:MAG TPA: hypothetical protein DCM08_02550 [Microscillaceae bacterium]|jgi:hypothetical protein|nr:hypothetical protein [Microscillaceae bacterium]
MQHRFFTLFTLLVISFAVLTACEKEPKKLIARKWKFSYAESMKALPADQRKKIEALPAEAQKRQREMMERLTFEFKADGSFTTSTGQANTQPETGTWSLTADGKALIMKTGVLGMEQLINIDELTEQRMILNPQVGMKLKMAFIPVNP